MVVPGMRHNPRPRRECSGEHFGGRACRDSAWRRYKSRPLYGAESQPSEKCEPTGRSTCVAWLALLESPPFRAGRMSISRASDRLSVGKRGGTCEPWLTESIKSFSWVTCAPTLTCATYQAGRLW